VACAAVMVYETVMAPATVTGSGDTVPDGVRDGDGGDAKGTEAAQAQTATAASRQAGPVRGMAGIAARTRNLR
jgi:hypothetical protein